MDDEKKLGVCRFCGQSKMIQTVGDVSQDKLNEIATNECFCDGAVLWRKKEQRKADIEKFLDGVPEDSRGLFKTAINYIEEDDNEVEYVAIKTSDGWTTKFNRSNDGDLVINQKMSLSKRSEL